MHEMVPPLMTKLYTHFQAVLKAEETSVSIGDADTNLNRLARVGAVLNWIVKVRGRKGVGELKNLNETRCWLTDSKNMSL